MPKFLLEVPHESEVVACAHAAKVLLQTGSHFLTHADFGCHDGVHKAWIVVEAHNKEEARNTLPVLYRRQSTIVELCKFSLEELDELITRHGGGTSGS
jgi:hypothetical protein